MHRGYTVAGTVTGKPVSVGGTLGRAEATGRGLLYIVQEAARHFTLTIEGSTVAVQGFGKVGAVAAQLLRRAGARIVAVSDSSCAIYNEQGLDIDALMSFREDRIPLDQAKQGDQITNRDLLSLPVDFLIPAALESQIHAGNADEVRARYVVEGANGPTTPEADAILAENGATLIPDIVANAGGVIVSYFEWVQDLQFYFWEEDEVNERLHRVITRAFRDVLTMAEQHSVTLREAAMMLGLSRVVEATRIRGFYP